MKFKQFSAALSLLGLMLALATPALAQNAEGKGGNKPPKCATSGESFPAVLIFGETEDGRGPQIQGTLGLPLYATVNSGNIASRTEDMLPSDLPITLDFRLAPHGYKRQPDDPGDPDIVKIDPHVATWVFTNDGNLESLPCQMFGMESGVGEVYPMRLGLQWHENNEGPQTWETRKTPKRWVLRYRPHKDEPKTWINAERMDANTWVLTSRPDSQLPSGGGLLAHFADLQDEVVEKKGHIHTVTHTTPVMPIRLVITVTCDGPCPIETGGS